MTVGMYEIRISLRVSGPGLDKSFTSMVDAYQALEEVHEQLLDASFGFVDCDDHAVIDVEVTVKADGMEQAYTVAASAVRAAIHEAGGSTPGWEDVPPHGTAPVYRLTDDSVEAVYA